MLARNLSVQIDDLISSQGELPSKKLGENDIDFVVLPTQTRLPNSV